MRKINALIQILLLTLLSACSMLTSSDQYRGETIIGGWYSNHEWTDPNSKDSWMKAYGEDYYFADGRVEGFNSYEFPTRQEQLKYAGKWNITDGYLVIEVTEVMNGFIKVGTVTKDKIVSMTPEKMVVENEEGTKLSLYRKEQ